MAENQSLLSSVETFLYEESNLLDEKKLEEWIDLFTEDGIYWVPCNQNDCDPRKDVSLIYDNVTRLKERLDRMNSKFFWAQDPPSRTCRLIGNVQIQEGDASDCLVKSKFVLTEIRRGQVTVLTGVSLHRLRQNNGGWKMREKVVHLLNNDEFNNNLTFLI